MDEGGVAFGTPARLFSRASGEPGAVLLETQRAGPRDRHSYLLRAPLKILSSFRPKDVPRLLEEAQAWQEKGLAVAGYLSYEAGFALEPAFDGHGRREHDVARRDFPLIWLGVYGGFLRFDHLRRRWSKGGPCPPDWPAGGDGTPLPPSDACRDLRFSLSEDDHAEKVGAIRRAIAKGDVYQANLTGMFSFTVD